MKKKNKGRFIKDMIPWNRGLKGCYVLSEQTRRKISEANKGRPSPNKGKHRSEETRAKISLANMGRESTKQKMSASLKLIWKRRKKLIVS